MRITVVPSAACGAAVPMRAAFTGAAAEASAMFVATA